MLHGMQDKRHAQLSEEELAILEPFIEALARLLVAAYDRERQTPQKGATDAERRDNADPSN
jgi:hypothetical protein